MSKYFSILLLCAFFAMTACRQNKPVSVNTVKEDLKAKTLFQGIWVDEEADNIAFRVKGDTVFYPDATNQPAVFKIINDTLVLGEALSKYPIIKQTPHLFWFKNPNGDLIKLAKSNDPNSILAFEQDKSKATTITEVVKKDTVVMFKGERYHCYIAINPTRYKVIGKSYNDDGVAVNNVYYDNIIHISVFKGAKQVYSHDFNKKMFVGLVPKRFLSQAVLSNMEFYKIDSNGFHFNASMCIPDAASCYMLDANISFDGEMTMEVIDY